MEYFLIVVVLVVPWQIAFFIMLYWCRNKVDKLEHAVIKYIENKPRTHIHTREHPREHTSILYDIIGNKQLLSLVGLLDKNNPIVDIINSIKNDN